MHKSQKSVFRQGAMVAALAAALSSPLWVASAEAGTITPNASIEKLEALKQTYVVKNFKIGGTYDLKNPASFEHGAANGKTLESLGAEPLRTSYIAVGTPHRDAKGQIDNAIIISTYYSGDATNMYNYWFEGQAGNGFSKGALIGPGRLIDTNRYYVVFLDALGLWGSSKPSDGLGMKFPQYTYFDMVQANYRLLRDHLKISKVKLATGVSMGATQTWVWGAMHPGFVESIMPIGGTTQSNGKDPVGKWTFDLATAALESDPVWRDTHANYYNLPKEKHPNKGVEFMWSVLSKTGLDLDLRSTQAWDDVKKDVFAWDYKNDVEGANIRALAKRFDAVDLYYRNKAGEQYDINAQLPKLKTKTMVIHISNDLWLNNSKAAAAAKAAPAGTGYATYPSPMAHYAVFSALNTLTKESNPDLQEFLTATGIQATEGEPGKLVARNYQKPAVAMTGDPTKSFWKTQLTSPFPVKYAKAKDQRGVEWEIGYMDEYLGKEKNPKTLMIIHGKGAFAAHYGFVMKYALERGLRVVALDMPHYGMSGPGNLDKSPARTLNDTRDAIYQVVTKKLNIQKPYCHGHSLGGQFCLGYALRYPNNIGGLILEAPAGLEQFPKSFTINGKEIPAFDPAIAHDFAKWKEYWEPLGVLQAEYGRTPQDVEDFFYFKKRDKDGTVSPSKFGYFMRDTEYARLHTDQRIAMISGNRKEYEQWVNAFIYDVYSIGSELLRDDPNSLYARLPKIKAPIFLGFGAKEPFIPSTALNGLTKMGDDVINPFMARMAAAGNRPQLRMYPDAGHFIHTDEPLAWSKDVVDFIKTGKLELMSADEVNSIIKGSTAAAAAPAAAGAKSGGGNAFSK